MHAVRYLQLVGLFIVVVSVGVLMGETSLNQKHKLEEKKALLEKENTNLGAEIKDLERKVMLTRSDPKTIEKVAKRKLGMARPDEMVYIFERSNSSSARAGNLENGLDKSDN